MGPQEYSLLNARPGRAQVDGGVAVRHRVGDQAVVGLAEHDQRQAQDDDQEDEHGEATLHLHFQLLGLPEVSLKLGLPVEVALDEEQRAPDVLELIEEEVTELLVEGKQLRADSS